MGLRTTLQVKTKDKRPEDLQAQTAFYEVDVATAAANGFSVDSNRAVLCRQHADGGIPRGGREPFLSTQ